MKYEENQYYRFEEEVKKYDLIDENTLIMLLSRYIQSIKKRMFVPYWRKDPNAQQTAKLRYYSFWIRRLHQKGILIRQGANYAVFKGK